MRHKKLKKHIINNTMMLSRKSKRFLLFACLIILIYIVIHKIPANYKIEYKINNYKVTEKYDKKNKIYSFKLTKGKSIFETISDKKYTTKKNLIKNIKEYSEDKKKCIVIDSKMISNNILCIENNNPIDYRIAKIIPNKYYKKIKSKNISYNNIDFKIDDNHKYFIWDYNNLLEVDKDSKTKINLFENDIYNLNLNVQLKNYLIFADYNAEYNFNKFIVLNLENNKKEIIESDYEISFDSKIIGIDKNSFYLIDKKNKVEYEINVKKETVEKISKNNMGKILKNNKMQDIKLNKIITDDIVFDSNSNYEYSIKNSNLYLKQKNTSNNIKISNKNIKEIVYSKNDEVYYIVEDSLYKYDFKYGERKILTYFELNFNYNNMIFIF